MNEHNGHAVAVAEQPQQTVDEYTKRMNKWFCESFAEHRPWLENLIAVRINQALTDQQTELTEVLGEVISLERQRHSKKIKAAVEEFTAAKLEASEQRTATVEQRATERIHDVKEALTEERTDRKKEIKELRGALEALQQQNAQLKNELKEMEQRLKSAAGKLPVARDGWKPETIVYEGVLMAHRGAMWQATKDTAQEPGGGDWVCVAGAGKDGRDGKDGTTPNVRGTYSSAGTYKKLDIAITDGAAFIATRDNPGKCPGPGWQMISCQGKRGHVGQRGERGERGPPGPMPKIIKTEIDEHYNLVVLRQPANAASSADNILEIFPLHPAFERFFAEFTRSIQDMIEHQK